MSEAVHAASPCMGRLKLWTGVTFPNAMSSLVNSGQKIALNPLSPTLVHFPVHAGQPDDTTDANVQGHTILQQPSSMRPQR